jgi:hypothetical protein
MKVFFAIPDMVIEFLIFRFFIRLAIHFLLKCFVAFSHRQFTLLDNVNNVKVN